MGDTLVLCGPVVGTVTRNSANVLLEIDEPATITCTATPVSGGPPVSTTKTLREAEPEVFRFQTLKPSTAYNVTFGPLAAVQDEELRSRGCIVRTLPHPSETTR